MNPLISAEINEVAVLGRGEPLAGVTWDGLRHLWPLPLATFAQVFPPLLLLWSYGQKQ